MSGEISAHRSHLFFITPAHSRSTLCSRSTVFCRFRSLYAHSTFGSLHSDFRSNHPPLACSYSRPAAYTQGEATSQNLWSRLRSPFCGCNSAYYVELKGEHLWSYSHKIVSVSLPECPYVNQLTNKAYLSDVTETTVAESFTLKMAAKTSWHRHGTKLRHCHPVYRTPTVSRSLQAFLRETHRRCEQTHRQAHTHYRMCATRSAEGCVYATNAMWRNNIVTNRFPLLTYSYLAHLFDYDLQYTQTARRTHSFAIVELREKRTNLHTESVAQRLFTTSYHPLSAVDVILITTIDIILDKTNSCTAHFNSKFFDRLNQPRELLYT